MDTKIDQLEYTVLELGTEVFRLKSRLSEMSENQEGVLRTLKNLRDVMDEKGLITSDDFELAEVSLASQTGDYSDDEQLESALIAARSEKSDLH